MKYDEFASEELREKYPQPYHVTYRWYKVGISEDDAKAAGWVGDFVLWVTEGDVMAVMKYMLVHMNGRKPEDLTDEYIYDNFFDFLFAYYEYIRAAFEDEAVARMRELVPEHEKEDADA